DEKALGEVTSWALAEDNQDEVFPDLPLDKTRTETDYLGPLFMALGVGADKDRGPAVERARRRLLSHPASQQAEDGSWDPYGGRRSMGPEPSRRGGSWWRCPARQRWEKWRPPRNPGGRRRPGGSPGIHRPTASRGSHCACSSRSGSGGRPARASRSSSRCCAG